MNDIKIKKALICGVSGQDGAYLPGFYWKKDIKLSHLIDEQVLATIQI